MNNRRTQRWQLGPWTVDPASNRLQNELEERALEPRVMAALHVLIAAGDNVVSDDQLLADVWRGQIVSDASLYKVIAELRKALGDSEKPYRFIERVSGKGYRLLLTPTPVNNEETASIPAGASIEPLGQHSEEESHQPATWSLDRWRETMAHKRSTLWLWLFVLLFIAVTLWQAMPKPEKPIATPAQLLTANTVDPERRPSDVTQADWELFLQARWLIAQRRADTIHDAVTRLQTVLDHNTTFAAADVELCHAYHFLHLYSDWPLNKVMALCEPLLRNALQNEHTSAAALAIFGLLKLSQGDQKAAAVYLDKSLSQAPDNAMTLMWRANLFRESGDNRQALQLIERAVKRDPLSGIIKRSQAFILINDGQVGPARRVFQEALLLEPDYSNRAIDELDMLPLTVQRARAFLQWAKKFPDRIRDANNPSAAVNLALIHLAVGNQHEADRALRIAENNFAQHQFTLLGRAMWRRATGDHQGAQHDLDTRATLRPNNPNYAAVRVIIATEKQPAQARATLEQLFPGLKDDPATHTASFLHNGQGQLVMLWLLTLPENQRTRYADTINTWLEQQQEHASLSINLNIVLGQIEQANAIAMTLLKNDWLPSPNDDFYVAEQHPLWQKLSPEVFERIRQHQHAAKSE